MALAEGKAFNQQDLLVERRARATIEQVGPLIAAGNLNELKNSGLRDVPPRLFRRCGGIALLKQCTSKAHLPIARFLKETFHVSSYDVVRGRVLDGYVTSGHTDLVGWVVEGFELPDQHLVLALRTAIRTDHLEIAQRLGVQLGFPNPRFSDCGWILLACERDVKYLRWLAPVCPALLEELRRKALKVACKAGNLSVVKFLDEWRRLSKNEILDGTEDDETNEPFRLACRSGNIELASWLLERFGLTKADVMTLEGWTFALCAREARLFEMGRWLASVFALSPAEISSHNHFALRLWLKCHGLESIRWFLVHFSISKPLLLGLCGRRRDKKGIACSAVPARTPAAPTGTTTTTTETTTAPETTAPLSGTTAAVGGRDRNSILRMLCRRGRVDVLQWLVSAYALTACDFREGASKRGLNCFQQAAARGHLELLSWMVEVLGARVSDFAGAEAYPESTTKWLSVAAQRGRRNPAAVVQTPGANITQPPQKGKSSAGDGSLRDNNINWVASASSADTAWGASALAFADVPGQNSCAVVDDPPGSETTAEVGEETNPPTEHRDELAEAACQNGKTNGRKE